MPRHTPPDRSRRLMKTVGRTLRHQAGLARRGTCSDCGSEDVIVFATPVDLVPGAVPPSFREHKLREATGDWETVLACDECRPRIAVEPTPRPNRAARRRALHRPRSVR